LSENDTKSLAKKILPRIAKAAVKAVFYLVLTYVIPMFLISQMVKFAPGIFTGYGQFLGLFTAIILFFVIASELAAGTVIQYGFNIAKALILIMFFVAALNGGIIDLNTSLEGQPLGLWVDLRVFLLMLITIDLLGLARSLLQTVNFLSESSENELSILRPTG
jgi:hypothetical protein